MEGNLGCFDVFFEAMFFWGPFFLNEGDEILRIELEIFD